MPVCREDIRMVKFCSTNLDKLFIARFADDHFFNSINACAAMQLGSKLGSICGNQGATLGGGPRGGGHILAYLTGLKGLWCARMALLTTSSLRRRH